VQDKLTTLQKQPLAGNLCHHQDMQKLLKDKKRKKKREKEEKSEIKVLAR
jgi:hypothetical protein